MANKKSLVLYDNWGSMLCMMQDEDAGQMIKAIVRYAFTDRDTNFENDDIQYAFETIKQVLNADRDKYNKQCERMEEARKQKSALKSDKKSTLKSILKSELKSTQTSMGDTDTDTDTDNDIDNDNDIEKDNGYPTDTKKSISSERFERFWSSYPKKVGKKAALSAWNRAKITDSIFQKIINTLERQKTSDQWTKNNGQFIPNPATWINQGRWDDEVVEVQSTSDYLMNVIMGGDINDTG